MLKLQDIQSGVIAHQVNCIGAMGCGVALAIRNRYPVVYQSFKRYIFELGNVQIVRVSPSLFVANLAGQYRVGRQSRQTDYVALSLCLSKLASRGISPAYFPFRMGCANAGGDWSIVEPMILKFFPDAQFFSK